MTDNFTSVFKDFTKANPAKNWLTSLRQSNLDEFEASGLPSRKDEDWRYFSVKDIAETSFNFALENTEEPELSKETLGYINSFATRLVYFNGYLSKAHSKINNLPNGTVITELPQELDKENINLKHLLSKLSFDNAFKKLNRAFTQQGCYIDIPKNTQIIDPIHIIFLSTDAKAFVNPQTLITVREFSQVQIIESFLGPKDQSYFTNATTKIFVGNGASVDHCKIQDEGNQAYHIGSLEVDVEQDGNLNSFCFAAGSKKGRNQIDVRLNGTGAHVTMDGLYVLDDNQVIDNHTSIDHLKPHTTSSQLYKGILDNTSRAVFNGKVFVRQDAQQINSSQLNRNMLLSPKAHVDTKPQLEIAADDVSCTHGATIGQISDEELFYIESRAIPQETARRMLVRGFADDVLVNIKSPKLRSLIDQIIDRKLK